MAVSLLGCRYGYMHFICLACITALLSALHVILHDNLPALRYAVFALGVSGMPPVQCDFSVLVTLQAAFANWSHATMQWLAAGAFSHLQRTTTEHSFSAPVTSLSALCLSGQIPACAYLDSSNQP